MTRIVLLFLSLFTAIAWAQPAHAQTGIPPVTDALVSPDGEVVVMVAKEPTDVTPTIYRYDPQAADMRVLLESSALGALRTEDYVGGVILGTPTFIPGTHTLLFYTEIVPNNDGIYFEIPLDLWSLDADTGTLTQLLAYGDGGAFSLSPSGDHLVIYNFDTIRVGNPDGTDMRVVYEGMVGISGGETVGWPETVWMGDLLFRVKLLDVPADDPNAAYSPIPPTQLIDFDLSAKTVTPNIIFRSDDL